MKDVCIIIQEYEPGSHNGVPYKYAYMFRGKKYINDGFNTKSVLRGEKFEVIYDSLHPGRSIIHTEHPVFATIDSVKITKGTIYNLIRGSNTQVYFNYTVNGKEYSKYQLLDGCVPVNIRDTFKVGYIYNIPIISIIYINNAFEKKKLESR